MSRLVSIAFVLLIAIPAFPDAQEAPAEPQPLRLMSDGEFSLFLTRLDAGMTRWKVQLGQMDVGSLSADQEESTQLGRSYHLCLKSLDGARKEIQSLSQKQTLRLDFLLLADLNDLARNLDEFNRDLIDVNGARVGIARKSLNYARGVLSMDAALALYVVEFQRHILAYAGLIDATLDQTEQRADPPQTQDEAAGTARGNGTYTGPIKEQLR
jgi:hypothetical protein